MLNHEHHVALLALGALVASGEDIVKPADSGPRFEYEGELVAVIGKRCRNVSPQQATACIFGWTIGNDVTAQIVDSTVTAGSAWVRCHSSSFAGARSS